MYVVVVEFVWCDVWFSVEKYWCMCVTDELMHDARLCCISFMYLMGGGS